MRPPAEASLAGEGEGAHSVGDILRAAADWFWIPRDGDYAAAELHLVRYPAGLGGGVRGSHVRSALAAPDVLDHAIERTCAWGEKVLTFWTNPSDDPDLEDELQRRGAELIDTVTVFALRIDDARIEVPPSATAEVVREIEQVRAIDAINAPVWDQAPLNDPGLAAELREIERDLEAGAGFRVLGRVDGAPVSTGGCTVVDGFSRLWGAATLAHARGQGGYRAVLAERLRFSAELGATTALVKGRVATSAPILTRAGFTRYGEERAYRLSIPRASPARDR